MANTFNFTKANKETPRENGWCQMWAERGFGFRGLYASAYAAYQAVPQKRGGTPPSDGNYYLIYFDGWFYGARYGDVALYRNGKVWSGSNVNYRNQSAGVSLAAYKKWLGTPQLCWSEFLGSKRIATIPAPKKPAPKPAPKPSTKLPAGHVAQKGTFTANAQSPNIRRKPSTKGNTPVARLWNGEKVIYDSYIDREGYRWISYLGKSGNRNYIARRVLKNGGLVYGSVK